MDQNRSVQFSMLAGQMSQDTEAFIIIKINRQGQCLVASGATTMQITFMEKALQNYALKVLNKEIPFESPT